jgi:hypothetical protein
MGPAPADVESLRKDGFLLDFHVTIGTLLLVSRNGVHTSRVGSLPGRRAGLEPDARVRLRVHSVARVSLAIRSAKVRVVIDTMERGVI